MYTELMKSIAGPLGQKIISLFVQRYAELFVSIDEASTVEKMIGYIRLHSEEFSEPKSEAEIFLVYSQALGSLLRTGVVQPADYGFSGAGKQQMDYLVSLVGGWPEAEAPATNPVLEEYAAFEKTASAREFGERVRIDSAFASWVETLPAKPVREFYS